MRILMPVLLLFSLSVGGLAQELEQCQQNLSQLGEATKSFASQNGGKFPLTLRELTPNFLRELPVCPVSEKGYAITPTGSEFNIYCPGKSHGAAGVPPNHPAFHSSRGLTPFKLSLKHARGKRVYIPGYRFKIPRGWLKEAGTKTQGATLRRTSDQSAISIVLLDQAPALPPQSQRKEQWQTGTAYMLVDNGYSVITEEPTEVGPLRGYLLEGRQDDTIVIVISGTTRAGFYRFGFEGAFRQRKSGLSTLKSIVRSLETRRK